MKWGPPSHLLEQSSYKYSGPATTYICTSITYVVCSNETCEHSKRSCLHICPYNWKIVISCIHKYRKDSPPLGNYTHTVKGSKTQKPQKKSIMKLLECSERQYLGVCSYLLPCFVCGWHYNLRDQCELPWWWRQCHQWAYVRMYSGCHNSPCCSSLT